MDTRHKIVYDYDDDDDDDDEDSNKKDGVQIGKTYF